MSTEEWVKSYKRELYYEHIKKAYEYSMYPLWEEKTWWLH